METETYDLSEIKSGETDDCLWVSLGFSSEIEDLDVLHVVCAHEIDGQDQSCGMDGIYLERFDQGYSCYKGASKILVTETGFTVSFNDAGRRDLRFAPRLKLDVTLDLVGYSEAIDVFRRMSEKPHGSVIEVR